MFVLPLNHLLIVTLWYLYILLHYILKFIYSKLEGCLTVHIPRAIMWNANLMQQGKFIDVFLARHVSGAYVHYQEQ